MLSPVIWPPSGPLAMSGDVFGIGIYGVEAMLLSILQMHRPALHNKELFGTK